MSTWTNVQSRTVAGTAQCAETSKVLMSAAARQDTKAILALSATITTSARAHPAAEAPSARISLAHIVAYVHQVLKATLMYFVRVSFGHWT